MSLTAIRNLVILLSNPYTSGGKVLPGKIVADVSEISPDLDDSADLIGNTTTLSSTGAPTQDGALIQGLLYVPSLDAHDPCQQQSSLYIPSNVTRRNDLPPTNYNVIALVPWINPSCAQSYIEAVRKDSIRAMLVYQPSRNISKPPPCDDAMWKIPSGDGWKRVNRHPVYAIPGAWGTAMMTQLSLYSGNLTNAPYAANITAALHPDQEDFVRVWGQLTVGRPEDSLDLWIFMLIVLGLLVSIIGGIAIGTRCAQRFRRESLGRRVRKGEVNLEANGIKRLRVPLEHVQSFPLFLYDYNDYELSKSSTASTLRVDHRYRDFESALSYQPCCQLCIENFVSKKSIIRELPCGHIFHRECIDDFLSEISSLCPLCKSSMLPPGYCPKITDVMVRRDIAARKTQSLFASEAKVSSNYRPKLHTRITEKSATPESLSHASTVVADSSDT